MQFKKVFKSLVLEVNSVILDTFPFRKIVLMSRYMVMRSFISFCLFSLFANQTLAQASAEFSGSSRAWLTDPSFSASDVKCVETWVYLNNIDGKMVIYQHAAALFDKQPVGVNKPLRYSAQIQDFFELGVQKGKPYLVLNGGTKHEASSIIEANKWVHLAANYNGTVAQIFVDGILFYEAEGLNETIKTAKTADETFQFVNIGASANAISASWNKVESDVKWGGFLNGNITQLRLWKTTRTSNEIFANRYNNIQSATSLLAFAPFNEIDNNDRLVEKISKQTFQSNQEIKLVDASSKKAYAIFKKAQQAVSIDFQNSPLIVFGLETAYKGKYHLNIEGIRIHAPKTDSALFNTGSGISAILLKKGNTFNTSRLPLGFESKLSTLIYLVAEKPNKASGNVACYFDTKTFGVFDKFDAGSYHLLFAKDSSSDFRPVSIQGLSLGAGGDSINVSLKAKDLQTGIYTLGIANNTAGNALTLDGNDQNARLDGLNLNYDFTIECWVKPKITSKFPIFSHGEQTSTTGFALVYDGNNEQLDLEIHKNITSFSDSSLGKAKWMHVALSYNKDVKTFTVFLNGDSVGNKVISSAYSASSTLFIGKRIFDESHSYFEGNMDELRIWNKASSATEIKANYERAQYIGSKNLLHYYDFNVLLSLVDNCADYGSGKKQLIINKATTAISTLSLKKALIPVPQPVSTTVAGSINGSEGIFANEIGGLHIESSSNSVHTVWKLDYYNKDFIEIGGDNYKSLPLIWDVTSKVINVPAHRFTFKPKEFGINAFNPNVNYSLLRNDKPIKTYSRAYVNQRNELVIEFPAMHEDDFNAVYRVVWPYNSNFYGIDDGVSNTGMGSFTAPDEYTLEFSFRHNSVAAWNSIKAFTLDANTTIATNASGYLTVSSGLTSTSTFTKDKWYHCAITSSKANKESILYINGVAESKVYKESVLSQFLVHSQVSHDIHFDNIRIWKSIRSPEEIKENAASRILPGYSKNLIAQYNFQANGSCNNAPELSNRFNNAVKGESTGFTLSSASATTKVNAGYLTVSGAKVKDMRYAAEGGFGWGAKGANVEGELNANVETFNRVWYFNLDDYSGAPHQVEFKFQTSGWFERLIDYKHRYFLVRSEYPNKNFSKVSNVSLLSDPHPDHDNSLNVNYEWLILNIMDKDFKSGYYRLARIEDDWGSALAFDGVDDHVKMDNLDEWPQQNLTLSCWVRSEGKGTIFSKTDIKGDGVSLGFDKEGRLKATIGGGIEYTWNNVNWPKNKFNHLALVFDFSSTNDSLTLWLNGKPYGGRAFTGYQWSGKNPAVFGAISGTAMSSFFQGEIDEFRIWTIPLKPHQIRNYSKGALQSYYSYIFGSAKQNLMPYRFSFNYEKSSAFGNDGGHPSYGELVNMNAEMAWRKTPERTFISEATELSRLDPVFGQQTERISYSTYSGYLIAPLNGLDVRVKHNNTGFLKPSKSDFVLTGSNGEDYSWKKFEKLATVHQVLSREWAVNLYDENSDGGSLLLQFITNDLNSANYTYTLLYKSKAEGVFKPAQFKDEKRIIKRAYNPYREYVEIEFEVDAKTFKNGYYTLGKADLGENFDASDRISDANIHIKYNIPAKCFQEAGLDPVVLQVSNKNNKIILEKRIDSFSWNSVYTDSFVYSADTNTKEFFEMKIYRVGQGQQVCKSMFQDSGSTAKHQPPSLYVDSIFPHKNQIFWENYSDHNNAYRLRHLRFTDSLDGNGKKVNYSVETFLMIDSSQNSFVDSVGGSLETRNGDSCVYCIQVQSTRYNKFYDTSCVNSKIVAVGFRASDNVYRNKVELTWNNIGTYCQELLLFRDGYVYTRLESTATKYIDKTPVPGKQHEYRLELYVEDIEILEVSDIGSVDPVGTISGRVLTLSGNYAVPNCSINAVSTIAGTEYTYTATTDSVGAYTILDVYFGLNATYSVTASLDKHTFSKNNQEVELSIAEPNATQLFKSTFTYDQSTNSLADFKFSRKNEANYVKITCKHNQKPTLFQLYRDNELLGIAKDAVGEENTNFIDSTAEPGVTYDYRVSAYQLNKGVITQKDQSFKLKTMSLLPINTDNLQLAADSDDGVIHLKWEYSGKHYTGVEICRDTDTIAYVTSGDSYIDFGGVNDKEHTYSLRVYKDLDGTKFYASPAIIKGKYPVLKAPKAIAKLIASETFGYVSGNLDHGLSTDYNFEGLALYRSTSELGARVLLDTFVRGRDNYDFIDSTGQYGTNYYYHLLTYRELGKTVSASVFASKEYPELPKPEITNFSAANFGTNPGPDLYKLTWKHNTENLNGTRVTWTDDLGSHERLLPVGKLAAYIGMVDKNGAKPSISVQTFKYKSGSMILSKPDQKSTTTGTVSKKGRQVSNFDASNSNVGFVRLSWDFPIYYTNQKYRLYRDEEQLGILDYNSRSYIDSTAVPYREHLYAIRVEVSGDTSNWSYAYGKTNASYYVYGQVLLGNGNGINNAIVTATNRLKGNEQDGFKRKAITDKTGYYQLRVPKLANLKIDMSAVGKGVFDQPIVSLNDTINSFKQNFVDKSRTEESGNDLKVAEITDFLGTPDQFRQQTVLRFNMSSSNYSGIEIMRGAKILSTINRGNGLSFEDSTGIAGFTYRYTAKAFWEVEGKKQYSIAKTVTVDYPSISAIENLTAILDVDANIVGLQWTHPTELLDRYHVYRDGDLIGKVKVGSFQYQDATGTPGAKHRYTITAVIETSAVIAESSPKSLNVKYPILPKISNLNLSVLSKENAIGLTWDAGAARTTGYLITRQNRVVDTIQHNANATSYTYKDFDGTPTANTTYGVFAYLDKDEKTYNGPTDYASEVYPSLAAVQAFSVNAMQGMDALRVNWQYKADNVDGYILYRDGTEVATIPITQKFYTDYSGVPNTEYEYSIRVYTVRNNKTYYSTFVSKKLKFPIVSAPKSLWVSQKESKLLVMLNWKQPGWLGAFDEERGYEIESRLWGVNTGINPVTSKPTSAWQPVSSVPYEQRYFANINPSLQMNLNGGGGTIYDIACDQYRIRSYRIVNGNKYYSKYIESEEPGYTTYGAHQSYKPTKVSATEGSQKGNVRINWTDDVNAANTGYHIYRRTYTGAFTKIARIDKGKEVYNDNNVEDGEIYIYEIRPVVASTLEFGTAVIGWSASQAVIKGKAVTRENSTPIVGANISASAVINKQLYLFKTTTDAEGEFEISNVFAKNGVKYEVVITHSGLDFVDSKLEASFSKSDEVVVLNPFLGATEYVVQGQITYANSQCGLDSVNVQLVSYFNDGTSTSKQGSTDLNGNYSISYNPFASGLLKVEVEVDSFVVYTTRPNQDTVKLVFNNRKMIISNPTQSAAKTTFNLAEQSTASVHIALGNSCGSIPGKNEFAINVRSKNGCFSKVFYTDIRGELDLQLVPQDYEILVASVNPLNATNYSYLEQFSSSVRSLSLSSAKNGDKDTVIYIYYGVPKISYSGLSSFCGNDASKPSLISTGEEYSLSFAVSEQQLGGCHVSKGFLVVYNESRTNGVPDTVFLNHNAKFYKHNFIPDNPNATAPFTRSIRVEYHVKGVGFISELLIPVIVQGTATIPGSDVFVNPSENDHVPLPLFVLRDPPGDGSYSYINEKSVHKQKIEFEKSKIIDRSGYFKASAAVPQGIKTEYIWGSNENDGDKYTYDVTSTFNKKISTAKTSNVLNKNRDGYLYGEAADIIVGAGLASQYGLTWNIVVTDQKTCKVEKKETIAIGPGGIKTTWVYTVDHINGLVEEYDTQIEKIKNKELTFKNEDGENERAEVSIARFEAYKSNWEKVLRFHKVETKPHVCLCEKIYKENLKPPYNEYLLLEDLPKAEQKDAVNLIKTQFCNKIGSYNKDEKSFSLNSDFTWTQDLIHRYNAIQTMIGSWDEHEDVFLKMVKDFNTQNGRINGDWSKEYSSRFEPEAKNITFGGGTSYQEELTVSKSRSHSDIYSDFDYYNFYIGLVYQIKVGVAAFGFSFVGVHIDGDLGYRYKKTEKESFSSTYSEDSSATVGYVLSDDDPGDQYSVTVVKGMNDNHTPFFSLLGGRSSCPHEVGAISRDLFALQLVDRDDQLVSPVQRFLDPKEPAVFTVKITNNNPFGEKRTLKLTNAANSNTYGAIITAGGASLANGLSFNLESGASAYVDVTVTRGYSVFAHEDIKLTLKSTCNDISSESVELKAYWEHPCTDFDIISDNNFTIYSNPDPKGTERYGVILGGYDVYNEQLEKVELKYRRKGDAEWTTFEVIEPKELITAYELTATVPPRPPKYAVEWNIKDDKSIVNGTYEIVAEYTCANMGNLRSNVVEGVVDRSSFRLIGTPSPTDGILSLGEEISVTYNKTIADFKVDSSHYRVSFEEDGKVQDLYLPVQVHKNELWFGLNDSLRKVLAGKTVSITVDSLWDVNGRFHQEPATWSFIISNNFLYWNPASLSASVYSGYKVSIKSELKYTRFKKAEAYSILFKDSSSWLSTSQVNGVAALTGESIQFDIDARNLKPGTYRDVVVAKIAGFDDIELPIELFVARKKPYWKVDASKYEHSIHVVSNYTIGINGSNVRSKDTLDIIAAFIGSELRGVSRIGRYGDNYAAYVPIYGNSSDKGKEVIFRVWRADDGQLYDCELYNNKTMSFDPTQHLHGTLVNPVELYINANRDWVRKIPLKKGWNWLSINVQQKTLKDALMSLNVDDGDIIKTLNKSSEYNSKTGKWISINGLDKVAPESGYLLHISNHDTLLLSGDTAKTSQVNVSKGWNLLGFPKQTPSSIGDPYITSASNNDILKSQTQVAVYDGSWKGTLNQLEPFQAYKLKVGQSGKLVYKKTTSPESWEINPAAFEFNMTITARLLFDGNPSIDTMDIVGAFVDGELRGVGKVHWLPSIHKYRVVLFVYSNQVADETINFQLFDSDKELLFDAYESVDFVADQRLGKLSEPYLLSDVAITGVKLPTWFEKQLSAYPNPTRNEISLVFQADQETNYLLTIKDMLGKTVFSQTLHSNTGRNQLQLELDQIGLNKGVYFLNLSGKTYSASVQIIKE